MFTKQTVNSFTSKIFLVLFVFMLFVPVFTVFAQEASSDFFGENALKSILYFIVVGFFGTLLGWAGELLNYSINTFVIGFGTFFTTQGVGVAVDALWSTVRDFFNILFIFGFIYIGFQIILDSNSSRAKQTLIYLLMAALLMNFSLFISKFVVDFSNRLASEVAVAAFPHTDNALGGNIADQEVDIANTFFAHMGIAETLNVNQGIQDASESAWSYIFGSAIFYLVGTFVFAAGAIMLIIRFVALSIFMVLSPFMFLGWVFPSMQSWTSKYWTGFMGRAFYAPVYIILLFFAGTILQQFFGDAGSMQNVGLVDNIDSDSLGRLLGPFILSCAFMIAAVQVAGKMSADGAGQMMKVGGNLAKSVQRRTLQAGGMATAGIAAGGLRSTVGSISNRAANNQKLKNLASKSMVFNQLHKVAEKGAGSSFDMRQVGGLGKSMGIGEGRKGGVAKTQKDAVAATEKRVKALGTSVDFEDPETILKLAALKIEKEKESSQKKAQLIKEQTAAGLRYTELANQLPSLDISARQGAEAEMRTLSEAKKIRTLKILAVDKEISQSGQRAKATMKYENEINYMKQLERSEKFWRAPLTKITGLGTGTYGAYAAGSKLSAGTAAMNIATGISTGVAAGGLAAGAAAGLGGMIAKADTAKASIGALKKKYGEDGMKALSKDKKKKDAEAIISAAKDLSDDDGKKEEPEVKEAA
jgi:hypothetical protein